MKAIKFTGLALLAAASLNFAGCASDAKAPEVEAYVPGLGEIMSLTSMRHGKLWFAAQSENWELATYELEELREGMEDAAKYHPTHKSIKAPIPTLIAGTMDKPMADLEAAIKARNVINFTKSYDAVTAGCNACHQTTDFGFNVVVRPTFNPYANQAFNLGH